SLNSVSPFTLNPTQPEPRLLRPASALRYHWLMNNAAPSLYRSIGARGRRNLPLWRQHDIELAPLGVTAVVIDGNVPLPVGGPHGDAQRVHAPARLEAVVAALFELARAFVSIHGHRHLVGKERLTAGIDDRALEGDAQVG